MSNGLLGWATLVIVAGVASVATAVCWEEYASDSCDWVVQQNHDPSCGYPPSVFWSSPVSMVMETTQGRQLAQSIQENYFCGVTVSVRNEYGGCMPLTINTTDTISQEAFGPPCAQPLPH